MAAIMCQGAQVMALNSILDLAGGFTDVWLVKLFSNNITPAVTDEASDYIEVTGGGYADITLDKNDFTVTPGTPSQAIYDDFQDFTFTGATGGPGTIYGAYLVDGAGNLVAAERFPDAQVPITPVNGTLIRYKPKITAGSVNP
jgi:hypothetical protein